MSMLRVTCEYAPPSILTRTTAPAGGSGRSIIMGGSPPGVLAGLRRPKHRLDLVAQPTAMTPVAAGPAQLLLRGDPHRHGDGPGREVVQLQQRGHQPPIRPPGDQPLIHRVVAALGGAPGARVTIAQLPQRGLPWLLVLGPAEAPLGRGQAPLASAPGPAAGCPGHWIASRHALDSGHLG